jgi:hypothetical protein
MVAVRVEDQAEVTGCECEGQDCFKMHYKYGAPTIDGAYPPAPPTKAQVDQALQDEVNSWLKEDVPLKGKCKCEGSCECFYDDLPNPIPFPAKGVEIPFTTTCFYNVGTPPVIHHTTVKGKVEKFVYKQKGTCSTTKPKKALAFFAAEGSGEGSFG